MTKSLFVSKICDDNTFYIKMWKDITLFWLPSLKIIFDTTSHPYPVISTSNNTIKLIILTVSAETDLNLSSIVYVIMILSLGIIRE